MLLVALGGGALASGVGFVARSLAPGSVEVDRRPAPRSAGDDALVAAADSVVETETHRHDRRRRRRTLSIPEVLDDLLGMNANIPPSHWGTR